jgi:hypothetical protein
MTNVNKQNHLSLKPNVSFSFLFSKGIPELCEYCTSNLTSLRLSFLLCKIRANKSFPTELLGESKEMATECTFHVTSFSVKMAGK